MPEFQATDTFSPTGKWDRGSDTKPFPHRITLEGVAWSVWNIQAKVSLQSWHLCQVMTRHLWQQWSQEYLTNLQQYTKWSRASPNIKVGDMMCIRGDVSQPTKWPLAQIEQIYSGPDGKVRVITLTTSKGTYTCPVVKIVPVVAQSDDSWRDHTGKAMQLWPPVCSSMNCLIDGSHASSHVIGWNSMHHCSSSQISSQWGSGIL